VRPHISKTTYVRPGRIQYRQSLTSSRGQCRDTRPPETSHQVGDSAPEQFSLSAVGGLGAGLVVLAGFLGWELTHDEPLLDPRLFRVRGFSAGTLTVTLQFFGFFGFVFLIVQYLQLVRGESALVAALMVSPLGFVMMPAARAVAPRAAPGSGQDSTWSAAFS
jgi:hypothetical protein